MRAMKERAGWGRHPVNTPTPRQHHPIPASSALGTGSWDRQASLSASTLRHRLQGHGSEWKRERARPALTLVWEKAGGGVRLEGPCPSQALVERGFVEPWALPRDWAHSWAEAWPPRPRRAVGLRPGARVGGLSMGLCACSQGASVAKLMAPILQPPELRPPGTQEPSPAPSLWLRADSTALTSTLSWRRSPLLYLAPSPWGLLSPSHREWVLALGTCPPVGLTE